MGKCGMSEAYEQSSSCRTACRLGVCWRALARMQPHRHVLPKPGGAVSYLCRKLHTLFDSHPCGLSYSAACTFG